MMCENFKTVVFDKLSERDKMVLNMFFNDWIKAYLGDSEVKDEIESE